MKIGLSHDELVKRTTDEFFSKKTMLKADAPEYKALADGDKEALKLLTQAAFILDDVFLKMDDERNIPFRAFLEKEMAAGNEDAELAMKLFRAQKGINAVDREAVKFSLLEGAEERPGKGLYPADLTKEAFHTILLDMLKNGATDEVRAILNQRSVIIWDPCNKTADGLCWLKAVDYTKAFEDEFFRASVLLNKAAECSTNAAFNEFLKLQAIALTTADPMTDAYADKAWADLQDTPLEFTITRENYADEMTETVYENETLSALLRDMQITPVTKDMLGFRVGIVNKEGTEQLLAIKKYLPELAARMPYADKYEQNIKPAGLSGAQNASQTGAADKASSADKAAAPAIPQTMVDVDIVTLSGDAGSYRAGITLAENLPNDDKLSLTIGGGRRNVYHRQIRKTSDTALLQRILDATLDPALHQFYLDDADHWFTIGHENGHSLGPNSGTEALGKYKSIIEENKADMIAVSMLDALVELGMYTAEQKKQIITTFVAGLVLKAKPNMSQAHRVRTVMQLYFLMKEGAVAVKDGVLTIDFDTFVAAGSKMLEKIIEVQISGSLDKAGAYVSEYFVWDDTMDKLAARLSEANRSLNGWCEEELAEALNR